MFQTEVIHALQSLASAPLTALMVGVTYLGYGASFFVLVVVVLFGVDFRKGYVLAHVVVWGAVVLFLVKHSVALPRPWMVDRTVRLLGSGAPNLAPFERMGAPGFWDTLPEAVVSHHRVQADASQGFPSGHVSQTVACWGALALMYRKPWLTAVAGALVLLMPLSRLYLGMHFLADVLGGLVLGAALLAVAYALVLRRDRLPRLRTGSSTASSSRSCCCRSYRPSASRTRPACSG
jgi:membrane-associated phospholipid phosphatase